MDKTNDWTKFIEFHRLLWIIVGRSYWSRNGAFYQLSLRLQLLPEGVVLSFWNIAAQNYKMNEIKPFQTMFAFSNLFAENNADVEGSDRVHIYWLSHGQRGPHLQEQNHQIKNQTQKI